MIHLTPDRYHRMPWKNGLGVTTELARVDGPDGELLWRVSIADVVADGPFSAFPGCDRVIVTLAGAGMVLSHPQRGSVVTLGPLTPYAFAGDWETTCALPGGPVRDFNLISRRGRVEGSVAVTRLAAGAARGLAPTATLVHALEGPATLAGGSAECRLLPGETVLREEGDLAAWRLRGQQAPVLALVVSIATPPRS